MKFIVQKMSVTKRFALKHVSSSKYYTVPTANNHAASFIFLFSFCRLNGDRSETSTVIRYSLLVTENMYLLNNNYSFRAVNYRCYFRINERHMCFYFLFSGNHNISVNGFVISPVELVRHRKCHLNHTIDFIITSLPALVFMITTQFKVSVHMASKIKVTATRAFAQVN